jgi:calpain-15
VHEEDNEKLIKLRNPWGKESWTGEWSPKSEKWTDELRKKLNYYSSEKDDGIFFISLTDFMQ